jgi:uncharacterized protein with NRDE domain
MRLISRRRAVYAKRYAVCTLFVAFRSVEGAPLVVAANRDERLDRPSVGPAPWTGERFVAPRDLRAGGTWLGLTAGGLFVGVTNRFGVLSPGRGHAARRSRGELVVEALRAPSARELHASLASLDPLRFNAFHLLYADRDAAFVTWSDGATLRQDALAPGVHVVTESSLGARDEGRTSAVLARGRSMSRAAPDVPALQAMMRVHGEHSPLEGTCVHIPALDYGTRSSMILTLRDAPRDATMFWAEGAPCTNEYAPVALPF